MDRLIEDHPILTVFIVFFVLIPLAWEVLKAGVCNG